MVLAKQKPDRPPVSFWHHFGPEELRGLPAIEAHLYHYDRFQVDFLKVMNDTGFPRPSETWVLEKASQLAEIREFTGAELEFELEYDIIRGIRERVGPDLPMIVTVFNSWSILRRITAPETDVHGPPKLVSEDDKDLAVSRVLEEDIGAVQEALAKIGRGQAKFAKRALEAGADGVFLSVRDDWVDSAANGEGVYDRIVAETDHEILQAAAAGWFNMVHVCGKAKDFTRFGGYPCHVLNWADRYAGPSIEEAKGMSDLPLSGGVDNLNTLPKGKPEDVEREVKDAIQQAGSRTIMITPGCTYAPELVPEANLLALKAAAKY